ncbi:MAG: DUF134 domain-containing protein [Bacteroidales bacterium]|nr:DUF134 domain-containing protein [Bacteroidales bacterium]
MSPRIKTLRKVSNPPIVKGFKPYGISSDKSHYEDVKLLYEEYEAIRLCDYDMLNHYQASVLMGVSRPTFTRIYASALKKIAKAMVEGRPISFEGGKIYFDSNWYQCYNCGCYFNNPEKEKTIEHCPLCGSIKVSEFEYEYNNENTTINENDDFFCVCPNCGYEQKHQYGEPCVKQICPRCHIVMKRNGRHNCTKFKN